MSQILNRVRDIDPNDSEAVKEALTAFFQNLPKHKDVECNQWLRALANIINRFPKYCGQHRITIENYLCHFLDSNNYYNVIEAAKCAHAVQQVRPQQERTASAKSCWRDQMSSLCEAVYTITSALFTKNSKTHNKNEKTKKNDAQSVMSPLQVSLADIDAVTKATDIANKGTILCTRLRNVLVFIQAMLVEIYPVAKPVRPQAVLEVILHAVSESGKEDMATATTVRVQALKTLDAIVACLGSNLIPFSGLVFRFVMQSLWWSSKHACEETRIVRWSAYSSLTGWLNLLRSHRAGEGARAWDAELTSHIVDDVTPHRHVIQLTPNAQPMKNLSKRARKKVANALLMQSNIASHMPGKKNEISTSEESNNDLAIAALECAEAFLTCCGIFLKSTIHKQLQELLVRECYTLDQYSEERAVSLLRALEACRKSCPSRVPPPTQYCLKLYSSLGGNSRPEISKFASRALLDIRLHLHCSPPSLNFALDEQPERKTREDKRKRLTERNRAVLETLLGKERMPSEDLAQEEIITIPDEPSSKRPRIDEKADTISLSSDSRASIEISDSSSVEELDDSADYIIEPHEDFEKDCEVQEIEIDKVTDVAEQSGSLLVERTDVTDGKLDDDADTIKLSQDSSSQSQDNIFDAKTQLPPAPESNEEIPSPTKGPKSPLSNEVAYDYPNTGQEKITVLEKMEEDNLPSTNDTDDVQLTCGQKLKSSQDDNTKVTEINEVPKENGVEYVVKTPERAWHDEDPEIEIEGISQIVPGEVTVTVEDMLADFVDEVGDVNHTQLVPSVYRVQ